MKIIIKPTQSVDPAALCGALAAAGLHDVTVAGTPDKRLEILCRGHDLDQIIGVIARDSRYRTAMICAQNMSGRITDLTRVLRQF